MQRIGTALLGGLLVGLVLAACGMGDEADPLDGRMFVSTKVTDDGVDRPLVDGTQIRLSFREGQIGASAGCNSIGGAYRLEDDRLVVGAASMTEMGCPDERMEQDEWLVAILSSRPTVTLDGDRLTLTAGSTIVSLLDREVAEPDLDLVGPTWTVDGIVSGDAVSSIAGAHATFAFSSDGRVEVDTGCNAGSGRYELTGGGRLRFADVVVTERACGGAAGTVEAAVLPFLSGEEVAYAIDANRLSLRLGDTGLELIGS